MTHAEIAEIARADQDALLTALVRETVEAQILWGISSVESLQEAHVLARSVLSGLRHELRGRRRTLLDGVDLNVTCRCRWCQPSEHQA